mgnify:CR=1 FL=1
MRSKDSWPAEMSLEVSAFSDVSGSDRTEESGLAEAPIPPAVSAAAILACCSFTAVLDICKTLSPSPPCTAEV